MKIRYIDKTFLPRTLAIIEHANRICADLIAQGYSITLRQLYYQFVSQDLMANKQTEYERLSSICNDARMAGLMDWDYLEDRTRNLRGLSHWDSPAQIIDAVGYSYRTDRWRHQPYRIEVWVEKDALVGIIERVCNEFDVPFFSCRGYTSVSEIHAAGKRLMRYARNDQTPLIIHLGDHDPSGMQMTKDIRKRLATFFTANDLDPPQVLRIALNMDQVRQYDPPPNDAKMTDSRAKEYVEEFGESSWELDALQPSVIDALIRAEIVGRRDVSQWDRDTDVMEAEREQLTQVGKRWPAVSAFLRDTEGK